MASEFVRRVRHVEDINTFSKSVLEEGALVLTNDNKMYALIGQEFKQLDNMEKVWATSEAGKYLMVGDDGIVKPMVIDDILGKDNTFTGDNTFTKQIDGSLKTRTATFTDYADVAKNMVKYSGNWAVFGDIKIANDPVGTTGGLYWYYVSVTPAFDTISGNIQIELVNGTTYNTGVDGGSLRGWDLIPKDGAVIHNTGNETSSGDKTFNGQTTLLNGNFGLRVTNSGIVKTTDAGNTWTAL